MRVDLHVHTHYSPDSKMSLEDIIHRCQEVRLNAIAVTDHNTIAGALALKRIAPFSVIIGEEILSGEGEIIGLFLTEEIPRHLPPEETATRIKSQGGLVTVPHPFDRFRRHSAIHPRALERILPYVDIIEVFNSRTPLLRDSAKARSFAQKNGFLFSAGSDAHTPVELGNAYVEMPGFDDAQSFRRALAQGEVFGHRTNPLVHLIATAEKLHARLKKAR